MKKSLLLVALSVCLLPLWGQQNFSRIDSLIKKMLPEASEVGISVYDLTAKKSLYPKIRKQSQWQSQLQ